MSMDKVIKTYINTCYVCTKKINKILLDSTKTKTLEILNPIRILNCGHIYHEKCINTMFKEIPNCPKCNNTNINNFITIDIENELNITKITSPVSVQPVQSVQSVQPTQPVQTIIHYDYVNFNSRNDRSEQLHCVIVFIMCFIFVFLLLAINGKKN